MRNPAAAVAALLLSGCTFSLPRESCWFTDYAAIDATTAVREETLHVTEGMGMVVVALDAAATGGEATWTVTDPSGNVRWRCQAGVAQQLQQTCSLGNEPGAWTVRRQWRGFAGTQQFSVRAASPDGFVVSVAVGR